MRKIIYVIAIMLLMIATDTQGSTMELIRWKRYEACENEYRLSKDFVDKRYIHTEQDPVARCSTFMTLVFAFESWYGKSERCLRDKNCFWIKWNWIDTPAWFLTFKTYDEWNRYFAKKYFRWHFNKNIDVFVHSWTMTDRKVYTEFMKDNYWGIYNYFLK